MKRSSSTMTLALIGLAAFSASYAGFTAETSRQSAVSARSAEVMAFSMQATTHVFTKANDGGVQQVVAKNPQDADQIRLIRQHLQQIATQFAKGDFSGPEYIHGMAMPGLAEIRKAKPGEIAIAYQDVPAGGQVHYSTSNQTLIGALHTWFDAQLADHGADAMAGHDPAHMGIQHENMKHE